MMATMFVIVMFYVNPLIDGGDGSGVLKLQLSFEKNTGIEIINSWDKSGVVHFRTWIFTDYIYAFSYSLFFASLVAFLNEKNFKRASSLSLFFVYLSFASGVLDFLENTMELLFIKNPYGFSDSLFFLHSVVALLKWTVVASVMAYILVLLTRKNHRHARGLSDYP